MSSLWSSDSSPNLTLLLFSPRSFLEDSERSLRIWSPGSGQSQLSKSAGGSTLQVQAVHGVRWRHQGGQGETSRHPTKIQLWAQSMSLTHHGCLNHYFYTHICSFFSRCWWTPANQAQGPWSPRSARRRWSMFTDHVKSTFTEMEQKRNGVFRYMQKRKLQCKYNQYFLKWSPSLGSFRSQASLSLFRI